jgi:NAD(P)-dependent dehydrogenase (short-subunit alcohol dehydrogenase family)
LICLGASKVILAVRSISKGERTVEEIIQSTKCSPSRLEVWSLDLSNYNSVKQFRARVSTLDRLDAFIQNAGILSYVWGTAEGNEKHVTVNLISAALLGLEVLPKLRESAVKTRLTGPLSFVGSDMHLIAKFKERDSASGGIIPALNNKEGADLGDR